MINPLVSIIIVNWNGGEVFKECLDSLEKLNYPRFELIVVDNGSVDGSENFPCLYKRLRNFKLIKNTSNLGFAKANNQGYKISKGEYILLLNNDTTVTHDFLKILITRIDQDISLGVIQPKIFLMEKVGFLDNAGSFLTRTGFLQHWGFMEKDGAEFDSEREIFSAKGACLLARREVIEKVGLFDEDFGSYFEETDFCWRVWIAGYKIIFYPKAKIYHKLGMTSKKMSQVFINYHSAKNRILSMAKNLQFSNIFAILGIHLLIIFGLAFYYLLKLQFSKSWMLYKAIGWNILHISKTLAKRNKIQKGRIVADTSLFPTILRSTNIMEMFMHFRRVEANFNG